LSSEDVRTTPRSLELLLTVAATALGVAFFASVPYWSKERIDNPILGVIAQTLAAPAEKVVLRGPSVLASAKPAPDLNLTLPDDIATIVRRTGINGETGLIPTAASITTFRLRATGDLVGVAAPTGIDAVQPLRGDPDPVHRVHGFYAQVRVDRGVTVIRWTERGVTYEVSSRTLDVESLVAVANKLR
jgi:hypothetical protein